MRLLAGWSCSGRVRFRCRDSHVPVPAAFPLERDLESDLVALRFVAWVALQLGAAGRMEHLDFCLLHSQKSCLVCHSILIPSYRVLSLILACSVTLSVLSIQPFPIPCVPEQGFSLIFYPETHHLPTAAHAELFVLRFDLRAGILRQVMEYLAKPFPALQDPVPCTG